METDTRAVQCLPFHSKRKLVKILGFESDERVDAMIRRIEKMSPLRPLRFGRLDPNHHATGGAEIFPDVISVSLRPNEISNVLLSHELSHVLIELEHEYLAINDRIERGTPDRRMIGTLLSMFEHPNVFEIQSEYGFDVAFENEQKFQRYLEDFDHMPPEPASGEFIEKIQGYVELQFIFEGDARLKRVETSFAARAPRSHELARTIFREVVTPERVGSHAYKEMLDAFVPAMGLQRAYWPPLIDVRPPARSDLIAKHCPF